VSEQFLNGTSAHYRLLSATVLDGSSGAVQQLVVVVAAAAAIVVVSIIIIIIIIIRAHRIARCGAAYCY